METNIKNHIAADLCNRCGLYVGTYHKYNCGSLAGAWLDMETFDTAEEFFAVCRELHADEHDPEFMLQDYTGIPECLYGESMGAAEIENIIEYANLTDEEQWMFDAYDKVEGFVGKKMSVDEFLSEAKDCCMGEFNTFEDFANQLADETIEAYQDKIPEFFTLYFDYEAHARSMRGYYSSMNGYVFMKK